MQGFLDVASLATVPSILLAALIVPDRLHGFVRPGSRIGLVLVCIAVFATPVTIAVERIWQIELPALKQTAELLFLLVVWWQFLLMIQRPVAAAKEVGSK